MTDADNYFMAAILYTRMQWVNVLHNCVVNLPILTAQPSHA